MTILQCPHCQGVLLLTKPPKRNGPPSLGPQDVTLHGRFGLTDRQAETADLVVRGLSYAKVAERMGVKNAQIVKNMMTRVFDAVGVYNRTQLTTVAFAGRKQLLGDVPDERKRVHG